MSIETEVSSMIENIKKDYKAIEDLGATIPEDKNIENIASCLEEVYDNLPKTTGEGTNLSLNTLKGKMNIQVKGDTEQEGTPTPSSPQDINVVTGTQIITISNSDNTETQTQTISLGDIELCKIGNYQDRIFETSGKNIDSSIVESGSLSNGENIAHGECYRSKDYIKVSPNTTYIFSINNTANRVVISMYNSNKEFISTDGANGYVTENGIFTTYSNCYYIRFRSYGIDGQLFNTGNIQIEERKSSYTL